MEYVHFFTSLICIEILLGIFYFLITPKSIQSSSIIDYKSLIKGVIERMFLMISLINDAIRCIDTTRPDGTKIQIKTQIITR